MTKDGIRKSSNARIKNRTGESCSTTAGTTSQGWATVGDIMTENIATVSPEYTVVSAAKIMRGNKISCLVISDGTGLLGIATETDMLKKTMARGNDFRRIRVDQIMSSPVRSVPRDLSVIETSKIMENENIRRLVVMEEGRSVGIITQTDVVGVLASYTHSKEVSAIMTQDVAVIASSATVREAADRMASMDISCLVATDDGAVAGIFTERDFINRVLAEGLDPAKSRLNKVMSSPAVTVSADYSVLSARRLMERVGIRRLVITKYAGAREIPVGIVTQTDILGGLIATLQEAEEDYFSHLVESDKCMYAVDLDLNTTHVNHLLAELLEVTNSAELIGKPFLPEQFWAHPRERERLLAPLKKARLWGEELTLKTAKGKRLSVVLFSTPTRNIRGRISGSHGVLYDVTVGTDSTVLDKLSTATC